MKPTDSQAAPLPLRERQRLQTRETIATAALDLFSARGFESVTVAEIAARAGVSEKTVFNHFGTKEELLFDRASAIESLLIQIVRERAAGTSPLAALREFASRASASVPSDRESLFAEVVRRSPALIAHLRTIFCRYEEALRNTLLQEFEDDDTEARIRAHVFAAAAVAVLRLELDPTERTLVGNRQPRKWRIDKALDALEAGFSGFAARSARKPTRRRP
jgi:AcrR family transcriptional regulator